MGKDYKNIPTPDKIPNTLDLSKFPHIPGTSVVRELSDSNKDLVARLHVQMRRNAELEAHNEKLKLRIEALRAQNEELSNTSLKNREIAKLHQEDLDSLRNNLSRTEIEHADMIRRYKELREAFEQRKIDIAYELKRHKKYRKNIQKKVRPYIHRILQENIDLMKALREEQRQHYLGKDQIQTLQERLNREKNLHSSKVQEAGLLQEEIIASYELELKQFRQLLDQREIELTSAQSRSRYLEEIRDKYVVMENKAIAAERVRFETEKRYDAKISELRQSILEAKDKHKEEKREYEAMKLLLEKYREENQELSERVFSASTQVASLQGRTQVEYIGNQELKALKSSLEKENQELRTKTESLKTENRLLREKLDTALNPPKVPDSIPASPLEEEVDFPQETTNRENVPNLVTEEPCLIPEAKLADLDFEEMSEIDKLIKEIEFGYPSIRKNKDLDMDI